MASKVRVLDPEYIGKTSALLSFASILPGSYVRYTYHNLSQILIRNIRELCAVEFGDDELLRVISN